MVVTSCPARQGGGRKRPVGSLVPSDWGQEACERNPADQEITLVGEQIAAARALSDLAGQLLHAAATSIGGMTHERTHLHL